MSIPELLRIGGFPDDYQGLDNRSVAVRVIGMSVPPQLMKAVVGSVIDRLVVMAKRVAIRETSEAS